MQQNRRSGLFVPTGTLDPAAALQLVQAAIAQMNGFGPATILDQEQQIGFSNDVFPEGILDQ